MGHSAVSSRRSSPVATTHWVSTPTRPQRLRTVGPGSKTLNSRNQWTRWSHAHHCTTLPTSVALSIASPRLSFPEERWWSWSGLGAIRRGHRAVVLRATRSTESADRAGLAVSAPRAVDGLRPSVSSCPAPSPACTSSRSARRAAALESLGDRTAWRSSAVPAGKRASGRSCRAPSVKPARVPTVRRPLG